MANSAGAAPGPAGSSRIRGVQKWGGCPTAVPRSAALKLGFTVLLEHDSLTDKGFEPCNPSLAHRCPLPWDG